MPTKVELEDRITELEGENQTLNDRLDSIFDIATANGDSDVAYVRKILLCNQRL